MNRKIKAALAVATVAAATMAAGAGYAASAATPSCGAGCVDIFSREFGTHHTPNYVMDVFQQSAKVGQKIILFRTSDTDPAEDINASFQGQTSDFFGAGLVSSAVELHYGAGLGLPGVATTGNGFPDDLAFELEYSPYGVGSGLCVGLAGIAAQGEGVTLQGCGDTSRTVWIVDTGDSATVSSGYVPLVNGSDSNFSHPFVLAYPGNGYPTDNPRPQLQVQNLTGFTGNFLIPILGTVNDSQLWGADFGVLK